CTRRSASPSRPASAASPPPLPRRRRHTPSRARNRRDPAPHPGPRPQQTPTSCGTRGEATQRIAAARERGRTDALRVALQPPVDKLPELEAPAFVDTWWLGDHAAFCSSCL